MEERGKAREGKEGIKGIDERTGQGRAGQDRAGQGRTGQDGTGQKTMNNRYIDINIWMHRYIDT